MDHQLTSQRDGFLRAKEKSGQEAKQRAVLFLMLKLDLEDALRTKGEARKSLLRRIGRLIERERMKAHIMRGSYDLNRHIALTQLRDQISGKRKGGALRAAN